MGKRRSLARTKGRREGPRFLALAQPWLDSPQWAALTPFELKLLIDLGRQYNGRNNGDLCAAWTLMQPRGWRSPGTLSKAVHTLREKGWLELTRQGGRHLASLYALTWWGIDDCGGKLDVAANPVPSNRWKNSSGSRVVKQCSREVYQSPAEVANK